MMEYRVSRSVRWSVGRASVTLTDGKGKIRTLHYPEAAFWDLLSRGYSFAKVVSMTAHIASLDEAAAHGLLCSTLEEWTASGFLERI